MALAKQDVGMWLSKIYSERKEERKWRNDAEIVSWNDAWVNETSVHKILAMISSWEMAVIFTGLLCRGEIARSYHYFIMKGRYCGFLGYDMTSH